MKKHKIFFIRWLLIPTIVFIVGTVSIGIILYTHKINERMHELFLRDDSIHEVQIDIVKSHLSLETALDKHLSGSAVINSALTNIDLAINAIDAINYGGRPVHGKMLTPITDMILMNKLVIVKSSLEDYRNIALLRFDSQFDIKNLDLAFNDFIHKTYEIDEHFEVLQADYDDKLRKSFISILIIWSMLIFAVIFVMAAVEMRRKKLVLLKDEFVNTISHEVRTPLTIIKESIYLAQMGIKESDSEKRDKFLTMSKDNADRLGRLMDDVLDYQKLCAGKMDFKLAKNDINELIKKITQTMMPLAQKMKVEFKLSLAGGLPQASFDEDRLTQVIMNLLDNAIKFANNGKVTIRTEQDGNNVNIIVKDNGIGIKQNDLSSISKSFVQLPIVKGKKGGSGLGLAISKKIIEQHRGKFWINSKYSKGSTFYCSLPAH